MSADVELWKTVPHDNAPHVLFPFPQQDDEIANEPTPAQMRAYKFHEVSNAFRRRGAQVWRWMGSGAEHLEPIGNSIQGLFDSTSKWFRTMWRRYTYKGEYRSSERNWNGRTGTHHIIKGAKTVSKDDTVRLYDFDDLNKDLARINANHNNALMILGDHHGPLQKVD